MDGPPGVRGPGMFCQRHAHESTKAFFLEQIIFLMQLHIAVFPPSRLRGRPRQKINDTDVKPVNKIQRARADVHLCFNASIICFWLKTVPVEVNIDLK